MRHIVRCIQTWNHTFKLDKNLENTFLSSICNNGVISQLNAIAQLKQLLCRVTYLKHFKREFPLWCNGLTIRLVSVEAPVQSPAQNSGLRTQRYCSCGVGCSSGSDLISGPGNSEKRVRSGRSHSVSFHASFARIRVGGKTTGTAMGSPTRMIYWALMSRVLIEVSAQRYDWNHWSCDWTQSPVSTNSKPLITWLIFQVTSPTLSQLISLV